MTITRQQIKYALMETMDSGRAVNDEIESLYSRIVSGEPFDLDDTKAWLRENFIEGCKCPACGKHVQLKDRKITPAMAKALIAMSKNSDPNGVINIAEVKEIRGGDYAKLRYWDLIEEVSSGRWRVTTKGVQFVADKVRVPKVVWVYNNRVRETGEETVNIRQVLGNPALYDQLVS